jgi:sterol desaturase/sphingolipid hydroxylase (fatty acid hydroxylase superfamily)
MSFTSVLIVISGFSGLVMAVAAIAFRVLPARYRIHQETERKVNGLPLVKQAALNTIVSLTTILGVALGFKSRLFYEATPSAWRFGFETLGILLLYDVLYYWMHRYPFHQWKFLRRVHSLHHIVRSPTALDSLYVHPLETFLGVALLMACTWIIGPVHIYSFAAVFAVYSVLNIVIHAGVRIPFFPFRFIGLMATKHDDHHASMRAGNYASITPIPDWIFGTLESGR